MPADRPAIPAKLERSLFIESGYRCAIPTCRAVAPLVIDHIDDWTVVKEHRFENMIVLCANCHGLKGEGPRKLDRKALRQYKVSLGIIHGRYGEVERRILESLAENPHVEEFTLPRGLDVLVMYLIKDGLLEKFMPTNAAIFGSPSWATGYRVTPAGREFVDRWAAALPIPR